MQLDFIIGGAQKCGTTTLHGALKRHDHVFMPANPQEIHFFDNDANYQKGLEWYASLFAAYADERLIGQTSPLYIYESQCAERIAQAFPNVKLIFILRNPVERAYSHYYHSIKKGYESLSFEAAIQAEPERLKQGPLEQNRYSYVDRGFYHKQLTRYLNCFPAEHIKVVLFNDLKSNPAPVLNSIFEFLQLAPTAEAILASETPHKRNSSKLPRSLKLQRFAAQYRQSLPGLCRKIDHYNLVEKPYPPMPAAIKQQLAARYQDDMDALAKTFRLDLAARAT